ncbi:MAG: TAXI family TRAP transporter solute-binding subunit [Prochloraceae cyanobacterium]
MASQVDRNHRNRQSHKSILPFNNSSLKYCRRIGIFMVAIISVITLNSCVTNSQEITLTSGSGGSGYQRISEQISRSAAEVDRLEVLDRYNSQGSLQNLQRLLDKEVDFAIVQLDVASEAMKQGKVQTLLILTEEYIHIVTREDSEIKTFADLKGKRIAIGAEGSGIYFTAKRLFEATDLEINEVAANFSDGLQQTIDNQVDAVVYVGPLGASEKVRNELDRASDLRFIAIAPSLVNYLEIRFPESYRPAQMPAGTYKALPELPEENLATISTPGALITRPDVSQDKVAVLTWSILSTFRQYYPFYAKLAKENDREVMYRGLIYSHPGALQVFENGDPRDAWLRYIQQNQPLQSGLIMLIGTSSIGFFLRWSRKKRSDNLIKANRQAILDMRASLDENPQKALGNVEALRQKYRLMLIDGVVSIEVYEQIERMTEVFAQQCRTLQQKQSNESVEKILSSIEQLQATIQNNPESSQEKIEQLDREYKQMLLSGEMDINTYLQLQQLSFILMSDRSSASPKLTNNNSQT